MKFFEKKQKLDYLLELIKKECTGNASELSKHIFVSIPTINRYLADLRDLGNEIGYCRYRNSYYLIKK
jgi:predicted DNA-binding transcriptional regulator YafY